MEWQHNVDRQTEWEPLMPMHSRLIMSFIRLTVPVWGFRNKTLSSCVCLSQPTLGAYEYHYPLLTSHELRSSSKAKITRLPNVCTNSRLLQNKVKYIPTQTLSIRWAHSSSNGPYQIQSKILLELKFKFPWLSISETIHMNMTVFHAYM